jgi:hypothetical protein
LNDLKNPKDNFLIINQINWIIAIRTKAFCGEIELLKIDRFEISLYFLIDFFDEQIIGNILKVMVF